MNDFYLIVISRSCELSKDSSGKFDAASVKIILTKKVSSVKTRLARSLRWWLIDTFFHLEILPDCEYLQTFCAIVR